jgi:osmoprotectant transport system ATP-binding protein
MSPLVSFRQVATRIGQKDILCNLSFDVEAGETLVLLGRSGSGKTTALKMVNALLLPSAGEVLIEYRPGMSFRKAASFRTSRWLPM